jgi:hypothetical protein
MGTSGHQEPGQSQPCRGAKGASRSSWLAAGETASPSLPSQEDAQSLRANWQSILASFCAGVGRIGPEEAEADPNASPADSALAKGTGDAFALAGRPAAFRSQARPPHVGAVSGATNPFSGGSHPSGSILGTLTGQAPVKAPFKDAAGLLPKSTKQTPPVESASLRPARHAGNAKAEEASGVATPTLAFSAQSVLLPQPLAGIAQDSGNSRQAHDGGVLKDSDPAGSEEARAIHTVESAPRQVSTADAAMQTAGSASRDDGLGEIAAGTGGEDALQPRVGKAQVPARNEGLAGGEARVVTLPESTPRETAIPGVVPGADQGSAADITALQHLGAPLPPHIAERSSPSASGQAKDQAAPRLAHPLSRVDSLELGNPTPDGQHAGLPMDASSLTREPGGSHPASSRDGISDGGPTSADGLPATRETFAALDDASSLGKPVWMHAGPRQAEAGFQDPLLGWVGVRADQGPGGIHAALVPGSADAAQMLGGHLAGLGTYLNEQHTPVDTLTLDAPEGKWAGGGGESGMNQGSGQNMGQGASNQPESATRLDSPSRFTTRSSEDLSGAGETAPSLLAPAQERGRISLMA